MGIQCKTLLVSNFWTLHFMYGYYNFSFNYSGVQSFSTNTIYPSETNSLKMDFGPSWAEASRNHGFGHRDSVVNIAMLHWLKAVKNLKIPKFWLFLCNYLFTIPQPRNVDHCIVHDQCKCVIDLIVPSVHVHDNY